MTDHATLEALLARVLEGTGPDRELDAEIALAFGIVAQRAGNCFYGHKHYSVMVLDRDYYDHDGNAPELPHFTASLDAAVTLVPEGWRWWVNSSNNARCWLPGGDGQAPQAIAQPKKCVTPALALIAACLLARMDALGE